MNWFARPVSLRSGEVCGGPAVKRRQRQHLGGREAVETASARPREQVLEPVPVVAPQRYEVLRFHYTAKIT